MQMQAHIHYDSRLSAVLIRANGERIDLGDMDKRKSWFRRILDRIGYDQRGLVTDTGVFYAATDFTGGAALANMKFHDSGTGTNAAAVTDTDLQTAAGPTTRATGTNTTTSGGPATSPAVMQSVGTITYAGTLAITEWGLFNQAARGAGTNLWDRRVFSAVNVASGDSIQFTYNLSIASGGS